MPNISISRTHTKDNDHVREIAEDLAISLNRKFGIQSRWRENTVHFERQGVSGQLNLEPGKVTIHLTIGLLFSAFSGQIEQELKKAMEKKLGPER